MSRGTVTSARGALAATHPRVQPRTRNISIAVIIINRANGSRDISAGRVHFFFSSFLSELPLRVRSFHLDGDRKSGQEVAILLLGRYVRTRNNVEKFSEDRPGFPVISRSLRSFPVHGSQLYSPLSFAPSRLSLPPRRGETFSASFVFGHVHPDIGIHLCVKADSGHEVDEEEQQQQRRNLIVVGFKRIHSAARNSEQVWPCSRESALRETPCGHPRRRLGPTDRAVAEGESCICIDKSV